MKPRKIRNMVAAVKRSPGRPKEFFRPIYIRLGEPELDAVQSLLDRDDLVTLSNAARKALRIGLRAEGLLPRRK